MTDQLSLLDAPTSTEIAAAILTERTEVTHTPDQVTSLAAAVRVKGGTQRAKALRALDLAGDHGVIPHDLWQHYGTSYPHVWATRLADLEVVRCVERRGGQRETPGGGAALVWHITDFGRDVLAEVQR